jgi:hypothetical protein
MALADLGGAGGDSAKWSSKLKDQWGAIQARAQAAAAAAAANDALTENANAVNEAMQKAAESAEKLIGDVEKEADVSGLGKRAAAMEELIRLGEASDENIQRLNDAYDRLDAADAAKKQAEAFKSLQEAASKVFEETRTPAEKYTEQVDKLNQMLAAGVLSWDTYARAVEQANIALAKTGDVKAKDKANLGDTPQLAATEIRFRASIPGFNAAGQDESRQDIADTADNTSATADATGELRDLFKERFDFDVADIQV